MASETYRGRLSVLRAWEWVWVCGYGYLQAVGMGVGVCPPLYKEVRRRRKEKRKILF
jgi:hypothetical protein